MCDACFPINDVHLSSQGAAGYLLHSLYATKIKYYLSFFPEENFLFLRFEDLLELGTAHVMNRVCNWLGIDTLEDEIWNDLSLMEKNSIRYPPMEEDEEEFLRLFFKTPNDDFYKIIGENFNW